MLDDDFSSIVSAVRLGRRIFDNLQKAVAFIIAVHIPIVGLSLIPVMMGWPIILMPVHVLTIFGLALYWGLGADEARALTFATLILANIGLIFTNRSRSRSALATLQLPDVALWWITAGAIAGLSLILFLPVLSELFSFGKPDPAEVVICLIAGFTTFGLFEAFKLVSARRFHIFNHESYQALSISIALRMAFGS